MNRLKLLILAFALPLLSFGQSTEIEVREMCQNASEHELVVHASRMMQERFFFLSEILRAVCDFVYFPRFNISQSTIKFYCCANSLARA